MSDAMDKLTGDSFFNGDLSIRQDRNGYRFSIDAILLAYYAGLRARRVVLDLGTGCGIIPLILAWRNPELRIYGVEIQKDLAQIASGNVIENRMQERIRILSADMKAITQNMIAEPIDTVVSNPPYRKICSGRMNPDSQKAIARHEIKAKLSDVTETAKRMLTISGRFMVIYPAERTADLLTQMRQSQVEPKFLRPIHSMPNTEAKLILAEGIRGGHPGMKIAPPLVIYQKHGDYSSEVREMFASFPGNEFPGYYIPSRWDSLMSRRDSP
jgi:tRNA1Val (adenine37-N6)-methyltransferase